MVLSLPSKYSSYEWSTGDTTASVKLYGSILGLGVHLIRVRVGEEFCSESDSITVTVVRAPGIQEEEDAMLRVFPVPATASIRIEIPFNNCEITILDAQGTEIYTQYYNKHVPAGLSFDLSGFKNGIYFIRINTGDRILMRKFVKI